MSLANVNHNELHLIMILPIEIAETYGPLGERRSGKTAEYECDRFLALVVGKLNGVFH